MSEGIHCSFCGKHKDDVEMVIESPDKKYHICCDCVEMSRHMLKVDKPVKRKIIPFGTK
jgi:ATP-dependent protease Clp ATPase subunit